jgi:type 1 fimbria pilin
VGCTISALSLDCAAGDYVKGSIDLKGTTEESGTIDEALKSFSIPSYRCTNATFTINGTTYDITSASLKIDNALESSPRTYASGLYAGQPQHGKRAVTINFEIPYSAEVETLKGSYLTSEENASVALTFSSPSEGHSITVTLSHVAISEVDANVGGTGILSSTVAGEALSVGIEEPITIVITDKISTPYGG